MDSSHHPKVAVVILNWNGRQLLEQFLPSVCSTTYPNMELIIGDNASKDDSIAFLKEQYPQIKILENASNCGYAEGYNQVLNRVEADYFVLLNSDVEVTPGWLEPMVRMMQGDERIGICQPLLLSYREKEKFEYAGAAGGFLDIFGYPFCRGRIFDHTETDKGQYNGHEEIFWASGAALMIRSGLYHRSGGLDGDFFAHMEEIDLCWRVKNMGYKVMICPESVVYHLGGGTLEQNNPRKTYLNFRNNLIMLRKNLPFHKAFGIIFIRHFLDLAAWFKFLFEGKLKHAFAINKAHYHFLVTQKKWIDKRRTLIKLYNKPNNTGLYDRSIVFDYYIRKKKTFSELDPKDFL
jgi:GT2 family glycosyltransferase